MNFSGDGAIGLEEFRLSCVQRLAYTDIEEIDAAYKTLLNVSFKIYSWTSTFAKVVPLLKESDEKIGGITLPRFQDLYAQFIGQDSEDIEGKFLFGPLKVFK